MSPYPRTRLRRLRENAALREALRENSLETRRLVMPVFVIPGRGKEETDPRLPGIIRASADRIPYLVERALGLGVISFLLFGVPGKKSPRGEVALSGENPLPAALKGVKQRFPETVLAADVCLCSFTESGHCGVLVEGRVDNDRTLEILSAYAVLAAESGADVVAPSAMMDGMVQIIREALDERGLGGTLIMPYSAKFASSLYAPFREAASSAPVFGDRRGYQLPTANGREALRELLADEEEGADILMIKPALPYLDLLSEARRRTLLPLAAYHVSGEYAMVKAAAREGHLEEMEVAEELFLSLFRAGADLVITYHALEVAEWRARQ